MEAARDRNGSSSSSDVEEVFPKDSVSNVAANGDDEDISIMARIAKFGELPAGHNPKVSCRVQSCSWTGVHKTRLVNHWEKKHSSLAELVKLVADINAKADKKAGETKAKRKTVQSSTPASSFFTTTTTTNTSSHGRVPVPETKRPRGIDEQLGVGVREVLTRAKARLQIRIGGPFLLHEWRALDDFVDDVVRIERQYPRCFISKSSADYSYKRTKVNRKTHSRANLFKPLGH